MTRSLELVSKSTISKDIFEKNISHTIIYHEKKKEKKRTVNQIIYTMI